MGENIRKWYKTGRHGNMFFLMNFKTKQIEAIIEPITKYTPNEDNPDENDYTQILAVSTQLTETSIPFDCEDESDTSLAIEEAMAWAEENIMQVNYESRWVLWLKSLMFWKYRSVWQEGKIVMILPKNEHIQKREIR